MTMSKVACVSCHASIDSAAKLCVFCGADPHTGARRDPAPLLEKEFSRREEVSQSEKMLDFFRKRQGIVVGLVVAAVFLLAFGLHQFITVRNSRVVADEPPMPLTEVADLSRQSEQSTEQPLPNLEFQYDGNPQVMRTFVIERGAVPPPPPSDQALLATGSAPSPPKQAAPRVDIRPSRLRPPKEETTTSARAIEDPPATPSPDPADRPETTTKP